MADIPKLDLQSKDIAADKQAKLKALFPEIFTEGDKIDFDKLRLTLGDSVDANDERFGLHWAGKKECFSIIQEPSIGTLKPAKDESVNWDDTENIFIEGDNLEVLKLLQKSYYGKVKMIYIDPPYNTGKEFIYPDKYQENLDTYLAYTGQVDDEGYKFSTNAETEGRFHSNWLNMMYPRLFLARNLLREDGVLFISIDDHEVHNLKKLCDEIFGEENFFGNFIVNTTPNARDYGHIGKMHEFVLFYGKNHEVTETFKLEEKNKKFKYEDEIGGFNIHPLYNSNEAFTPENRPNLYYPFYLNPDENLDGDFYKISLSKSDNSIELYPPKSEKNNVQFVWRWGRDKSEVNLNKEIIGYKTGKGEYRIVQKMRHTSKIIRSMISGKPFTSRRGTAELEELFGNKIYSFPKPTELIKTFIKAATKNDDIILDFFSGSCSTANAVSSLSKEEGNRNFIMVQLPEPVDNKDYSTISDIGKERIRRVFKNINLEKQNLETELQSKETALAELETLKAKTPKLFENGKSNELADLEDAIEELKTKIANIESTDLGFKVFKLDKSNFKVWDGSVENDVPKQIQMAINHLEPDSKEFDILFEILLKAGFELTLPIKELTLADKKVYSVEDDALLICLENELNEDVIRAIAAKEPARFVCLDTGFKDNDQLKTNAVQIMKSHNVHDFKTV